jgi:excisionase family DNA binding protein
VWLTPDEVAERLKLHRGTVYRLIAGGILPAVRIERALRVSSVELDEWLRSEPEQRGTTRRFTRPVRRSVSDE